MASTGKDAWAKHFKGKGNIATTMKKDSALLDADGVKEGTIKAGESVVFLDAKDYSDKMAIEYKKNVHYVTFNNVQKPKSKLVSGIKLKPQDYKFFTVETWDAKKLAKQLIDETEERQDLDPTLKTYIQTITAYWGKTRSVTRAELNKLKEPTRGINEINKDYGEMLGAIACVQHKILTPHIKLGAAPKLNFPLRGNEPIVDYYVLDGKKKHSISAKSGTTTNTLKPGDAVNLIKAQGNFTKWQNTAIIKFIDLVSNTPTAHFPFHAINFVEGKKVLSDAAISASKSFKVANFSSKNYDVGLFGNLIKLIKIPGKTLKSPPTIGELFYYTEKYIIQKANSVAKFDPTKLFVEATSGQVIYVKYAVTAAKPEGEFHVIMSDANKDATAKKIKWRSKNATSRASDKLGIQP